MKYTKAIAAISLLPFTLASLYVQADEEMMDDDMMMENTMMDDDDSMMSDVDRATFMTGLSTNTEVRNSAVFIADMDIIEDYDEDYEMYNLGRDITRREMLKVMMNISGETVVDTCNGDFEDLDSADWGCKYAEAALDNGFIAANAMFRPDDLVSEAEALKMIMQARGIDRDANDDWRAGYESEALSRDLIDARLSYDMSAKRGWIFRTAARSYSEFMNSDMMNDDDMMMDERSDMTIVEAASSKDEFSTLVTALEAADLVDTLNGDGPFTVFAPYNSAFDMLPNGTLDDLLMEENMAELSSILTFHVVAGEYLSSDITNGLELETVNGATLMFTVENGMVYINGDTMIEMADMRKSNGVVHAIDMVLMSEDMMDDDEMN